MEKKTEIIEKYYKNSGYGFVINPMRGSIPIEIKK